MIDINAKIMEAMKAREKERAETYKLLKAKILEFKTAKNAGKYDEVAEVNLILKMIEERANSSKIYSDNGREDLAQAELIQMNFLNELLPPAPTEEDIVNYISKKYPNGIEKKDMGAAVKDVKANLLGADGRIVAGIVKANLLV